MPVTGNRVFDSTSIPCNMAHDCPDSQCGQFDMFYKCLDFCGGVYHDLPHECVDFTRDQHD